MKKLLIFLLILFPFTLFSQSSTEWFASDLNIQPFTANFLEPRTGFMFALEENQLQLNIGTSRDVVQLKSGKENISIGADFFTFTRLRSESSFKFPVETIDYLFGVNAGYKLIDSTKEIGVRFRFIHISAHLVDGRFDEKLKEWIEERNPITFSKEFIELFPYYRINGFRIYLGLTYIVSITPSIIDKGIYQLGFDYYVLQLSSDLVTPFVAYDFKLSGINGVYSGNNIIKAGVKFGKPLARGFSILFAYFSGKSVHGEFFDLNENYFSIGFNLDL
ncbi:MAG: DUF1207 domain-containing protein [Ignavibacterium sp.]|nr:MAG: DUF1207 domain-containing protein [Ignavibacterium sp.]